MADSPTTKFENALIDLIEIHMDGGLSGAEVRGVLIARADDDFDAAHRELNLPNLLPDQEEYLRKIQEDAGKFDPNAMVGGPYKGKP